MLVSRQADNRSHALPDTAAPSGLIAPDLAPAAPRGLCTDCGVSRMENASECGRACQFIQPDYPFEEVRVHGRARDMSVEDEVMFGPHVQIYRAALKEPKPGAQWTGLTTELARSLLERGEVTAVLTVGPDPEDSWKPQPVIVTDPARMADVRGMRMGYAPVLALLETAARMGHTKLAVVGIPCQIYALRRLEEQLGLEALYVIGTPCSDNTTTENFHHFLERLTDRPEDVTYLEFRADYHVELRFADGSQRDIPFLKLPLSDLPNDFFPMTCKTCVDYTNALSDITVGYMGGQGDQWVIVRNERGAAMLNALGDLVRLETPGTGGKRASAVKGFLENTRRAAGGLPLRKMPDFMRGIMGWLMPKIGPKGMEFAKARLEMKAIETVLHLRREHPAKMKNMVPDHVWTIAEPYDLKPEDGEKR